MIASKDRATKPRCNSVLKAGSVQAPSLRAGWPAPQGSRIGLEWKPEPHHRARTCSSAQITSAEAARSEQDAPALNAGQPISRMGCMSLAYAFQVFANAYQYICGP